MNRAAAPFCLLGACSHQLNLLNGTANRNPVIQDENITITYEDRRLGFAGGPPVPLVTVAVSDLPIPIIGAIIDLAFRLVGGEAGANTTMRTISASMTAEDLNTAGAP